MRSLALADDDVRIASDPRHSHEDLNRRRIEPDQLTASFGVRQLEHALFKINIVPAQGQDFAQACTGKNQQANSGESKKALTTLLRRRSQRVTHSSKLIGGQI